MPVITALRPQRNKKQVNVYVDGKFAFGIDLDNIYKFGIKAEKEFSKEELEKINKAANFNKTFNKLLNFATLRPRSEKEVSDWFYKKRIDKDFQERLIKKLQKLELLDDGKFAVWWVKQRNEFRPRAKRALKFELLKKGIDKDIISKTLEGSEIDEVEMASGLLKRNKYKWERYDAQERKNKQIAFLQRKGFGWDVVKKIVG